MPATPHYRVTLASPAAVSGPRRTESSPALMSRRASGRRRHKFPLALDTETLSPGATSAAATTAKNVDLQLTLEDFVKDSHLHSIFLQYLSTNDKKGFARLLFLVSVEEFKKLIGTSSPEPDSELATPSGVDSDGEEENDHRYQRRMYASKIISKFMSQDSFLDIASENLKILNKSVWSFGSFLRNDLMMCTALSSKVDLFDDAEVAVRKALQPSFEEFMLTKEYQELVMNARISYALIAGDQAQLFDSLTPSFRTRSEPSHTPAASPLRPPQSHLTLERVLSNRRLCSVFWVFLFKERVHQQLSMWMEFRYQLLPVLESFINAANAELEAERQQLDEEIIDDVIPIAQPGEFIEQILMLATKVCDKFLAMDASCLVSFLSEADQEFLYEFERHATNCVDVGSFALVDAETMLRTIQKIMSAIEYNLQVNDFVRFMGSDSFRSLVSSYQSRLLSPSSQSHRSYPHEDAITMSASSDCSVTTLQELFQCMNVPSHQPQRDRSKKFGLKELFQSQLRGESQRSTLISSILSFRLDGTNKDEPVIIKDFLHTLANTSDMRHHHALPDHVESFFCPSGAKVIRARTRPKSTLFHMTIGNADKAFYGACLTRYVPQDDDSQLGPLELVLRETEGLEVYIPVGLCIVSRFPILDTLKKRLNKLHVEMQNDHGYLNDAHWKPSAEQLEELLSPFDFSTVVNGSFAKLEQHVDFSMEELFGCLSIDNVLSLVNCMMLERQIVLVSSRYSVLTCVGETLKSLIAPLEWSHVFAPILPKSMLEVLQCPTPYLFGVHSSYRKELTEMLSREGSCEHIVVVDLDANSLSSSIRPHMPEHVRGPLKTSLEQLLKPRVYFSDHVPMRQPASPTPRRFPQTRVRECFQTAISQLLQPFEEFRFVLSDDFDLVVVFDRIEFLRRVPLEELLFYRSFLETQVFSHQIASVA
ncbi:hypothetical protein Poli38472_005292 [Pythium oligandrum]|uniref:UDENN domain-containing protein n=1 Tax=Pythium oligandrum TaxID=41045 RepID=A0A8K1CGL9_PYTOL|nr:hypothetical protein Poli38472_005292 [Pythium oligandrum]|eukprot:TMW62674.1 hypothetical protein Poli38472_005292 [Pythium oligandrum]